MVGITLFSLLVTYGIYSIFVDDSSDNDSGNSEDESYHDDGQTEEEAHNGDSGDDQTDQDGSDSSSNEDDSDTISHIIGNENDEALNGTSGADLIDAYGGNDTVNGGAGGDTISGHNGNDRLNGEGWRDLIDGGAGRDTITGGRSEDLLFGGVGADSILGGAQSDTLLGGNQNDTLLGQNGYDWLIDLSGNNSLVGGEGDDVLIAAGDFSPLDSEVEVKSLSSLFGNLSNPATASFTLGDLAIAMDKDDQSGADVLSGGRGDDTLVFGADDTASGGDGSDTFAVVQHNLLAGDGPAMITDFDITRDELEYNYSPLDGEPDLSLEDTDAGLALYDGERLVMLINGDIEGFTLENVTLSALEATRSNDGDDNLNGGDGDDYLALRDGDDRANGGAGDDILRGGDGKDTLSGGAGDDELKGGDQSDKLNGGTGNDTLNGTDTDGIYTSFRSYDGEGFADIRLGSLRSDGADLLNGGYGDDVILAAAGDTVIGGEGDDLMVLIDHDGSADMIVVEDFSPSDDYLMIKYMGSVTPALTASVNADGHTVLALDGKDLFMIKSALPDGYDILNAIALEKYRGGI